MIKVKINDLFHKASFGIWIMDRTDDRGFRVAQPVQLVFGEVQGDAFMLPEPTIEIDQEYFKDFLQSLVDEAARHGITPKTDKIAGVCEAQRAHIASLEKIVERAIE